MFRLYFKLLAKHDIGVSKRYAIKYTKKHKLCIKIKSKGCGPLHSKKRVLNHSVSQCTFELKGI